MKIIFFAHCLHHKKFEDRYISIKEYYPLAKIYVIGYDWFFGRNTSNTPPKVEQLIKLKKYNKFGVFSRILGWPRVIFNALRIRKLIDNNTDLVIVNSWEFFLISALIFKDVNRKIFDLADIHPMQTEFKYFSKLIILIERILSKNWIYVVTSPWFYWIYLNNIVNIKPLCYLVENKISKNNFRTNENLIHLNELKSITILWNGVLRSNECARFLLTLVNHNHGAIKLRLAGDYKLINRDLLDELLNNQYVSDFGRYDDNYLVDLFDGVTYSWISDLLPDLNAKILLPNRLYQAVFFEVPCLSVGDSVTTNLIINKSIGIGCADVSIEKLSNMILNLSVLDCDNIKTALRKYSQNCIRSNDWSDIFSNKLNRRLSHTIDYSVLFSK